LFCTPVTVCLFTGAGGIGWNGLILIRTQFGWLYTLNEDYASYMATWNEFMA